MKKLILAAALAVACGVSSAAVIDFNGHSNTIFDDEEPGNGLTVLALDGFTFRNEADHFHLVDLAQFGAASNGTSSLLSDRGGALMMDRMDGGLFDVTSLLGYGYFSSTLTLMGTFFDGSSINATFDVNPDSMTRLDLVGFTDLRSLTFTGAPETPMAPAGFGIDDLVLNGAGAKVIDIPEPVTFGLLGIGLAALAANRRRAR